MAIIISESLIPIQSPVGNFNAWTKSYGDDSAQYHVLVLQGGPGTTHDYMEELGPRLSKHNLKIIFFGPIGTHYSEKPDNFDFCDMDWFVNEVDQVRNFYSIPAEKLILLGQSWGGQLALEYALKYQEKISALIISNAMASMPAYNKHCAKAIIPTYPPDKWKILYDLDKAGDLANPLFVGTLMDIHYPVHVYRHPVPEWPHEIVETFKTLNYAMYSPACGGNPTTVRGYLATWDRSSDLKNVKVPTLTIGSKYDAMDANYMEWMSQEVQNGSYVFCPNSGHFAHLDDKEIWTKGVINFIKNI